MAIMHCPILKHSTKKYWNYFYYRKARLRISCPKLSVDVSLFCVVENYGQLFFKLL